MKQCPNCRNTYTDDSLQFCLADGAPLINTPDLAETVQMSAANHPLRVNIPPDSAPTVFAQTPFAPSQTVQDQPAKKSFGLIIAGVLGVLLILGIAGFAAVFFLFRPAENKNPIVSTSPTPTVLPTVSPTAAPNDETARLKEEMANLKKQVENQKKQKANVPTDTASPSDQKLTTARANSPDDGFLALRSEPNSETGYRIAKIPHGATVTVLNCPKPSNVGKMAGRWCRIIYDGQSGWAFDAFMTF